MPLLYDRLLTGKLQPAGPSTWRGTESFADYAARLKEQLREAVVIVADNVCEYFYAGNDQEYWDVHKDFPCVAPPFDCFWIEMRRPSQIVSREVGVRSAKIMPKRWGFLYHSSPMSETVAAIRANPTSFIRGLERFRDQIGADLTAAAPALSAKLERYGSAEAAWPHLTERESKLMRFAASFLKPQTVSNLTDAAERIGGWALTGVMLAEDASGALLMPGMAWSYAIDPLGAIVEDPLISLTGDPPDQETQERAMDLNTWTFPALLAISFMHCKNVERILVEPEPKLSRAFERRHKEPLTKFYTLEIAPMQRVLVEEGKSKEVGLKQALHIVRGHFAHYGEAYDRKRLFGKYEGQFWVPAHVRGDAEIGTIAKDYSVAPQEQAS